MMHHTLDVPAAPRAHAPLLPRVEELEHSLHQGHRDHQGALESLAKRISVIEAALGLPPALTPDYGYDAQPTGHRP